jgi:hypothetical protein
VKGSKGCALGGVQRQGLWSGFGVKPRALLLASKPVTMNDPAKGS